MTLKRIFFAILLVFVCISLQNVSAQSTVVSVTGSVYNAVTHEPVSIFLIVMDQNGRRVTAARSNAAEDGYYFITSLKPGNKYTINIGQKGYFKEQFELDIPNSDRYEEISKDFLIKPLEKDVKIPFQVSPYELNKSKLRFGIEHTLDGMASALKNNPEVYFEIKSFPDNAVDKATNQELTKERAESLMEYFVEKGIDKSRITISGSATVDPQNPPPVEKRAKGKRYIGTTYIVVKNF